MGTHRTGETSFSATSISDVPSLAKETSGVDLSHFDVAFLTKSADAADIPGIVVTASDIRGDRESMLGHGFNAYVSRPIDEELLLRAIRNRAGTAKLMAGSARRGVFR